MSLEDFFVPVDPALYIFRDQFVNSQLGKHVQYYISEFPDIARADIAIFGVKDARQSINNRGCDVAVDKFRAEFSKLFRGAYKPKIADLGDIIAGHRVEDTYAAVRIVVSELIRQNVVPVLIGGGQDITYAQYRGYENLEQRVDLVVIDSAFDLEEDAPESTVTTSRSYLSKIMLHEPNYLFNFSNIGYQTYFVGPEGLEFFEKLYFDTYRLGSIQGKLEKSEPILRNADMISFDMGAIRASDAPANQNAGPNGFYGEEACRLCRYAGMSDKLSSIGFFEMNPALDRNDQTAGLLAQMVWYFVDGFYNRKKDFPLHPKSAYILYRTSIKDYAHELVFIKSKKSDRWWMQVPYPNTKSANDRFHLVPCDYDDYQTAVKGEMPDLWVRTYQKLV